MVRPLVASLVLMLVSGCFSPSGSEPTTGTGTAAGSETLTTGTAGTMTTMSPITTGTGEPTTSTDSTTMELTTGPLATATASSSTTTGPDTTSDTAGDVCGDSVLGKGEECDDGNMVEGDGCSNACKFEVCGDAIVQPNEECDGGEACTDCKRTFFHVFVTAEPVMVNDFKGTEGADALCTTRAKEAGLGGAYVAWLSSVKHPAATRLAHGTRPWLRLDGSLVAKHWDELIDGALGAAIDVDEHGLMVPVLVPNCGACPVWTATDTMGAAQGADCNGWIGPPIGTAVVGECTLSDSQWTENCPEVACDLGARLYCFEQQPAP
ncbi:DUF4215 domain-containing protein [Nannocystis bainbridge]|uniref:DUF4215 domain-containing protein n=1 Tax=Nannocystis bainbridge TaxID=2995303 RepID=A0ABT5DPB9_9BACT|nr:DUF4215 domain-containing protein [Nannocystis bainbridge]MDC0715496.1 DUF4215 domain-containing protein [Nannocystis bainbridge]